MLKLLEGHLPHVIDWLVDEHGEVIVARALGAHYEGLRAGEVGLDSIDAEVMQSLCGLVNGALAAGAAMPATPEPDAGLQPAVESPADGPEPEANDEPEQRSAQTAALAAVPEKQPERSIRESLSGPLPPRLVEILALRILRRELWHQVDLRKSGGSSRRSFFVAGCKVNHMLITQYQVADDRWLVPDKLPPESAESVMCYTIRNLERQMQAEKAGGSRVTRILRALGFIGEMPVEVAIRRVIEMRGLQIEEKLIQGILRQGREGCNHTRRRRR